MPYARPTELLEVAKTPRSSWTESLSNAQVLLEARIAREGGRAKDLVLAEAHLNRVRLLVEDELAKVASGPPKREGRTGARITEYRVEDFNGEETLTEYRGPQTEPFRTPRWVYDAVVKYAVARAQPFDFMELFDSVRKSNGELPDYRLRVCTRFMVAAGVLRHERRRFASAVQINGLQRLAESAWKNAVRKPLVPGDD